MKKISELLKFLLNKNFFSEFLNLNKISSNQSEEDIRDPISYFHFKNTDIKEYPQKEERTKRKTFLDLLKRPYDPELFNKTYESAADQNFLNKNFLYIHKINLYANIRPMGGPNDESTIFGMITDFKNNNQAIDLSTMAVNINENNILDFIRSTAGGLNKISLIVEGDVLFANKEDTYTTSIDEGSPRKRYEHFTYQKAKSLFWDEESYLTAEKGRMNYYEAVIKDWKISGIILDMSRPDLRSLYLLSAIENIPVYIKTEETVSVINPKESLIHVYDKDDDRKYFENKFPLGFKLTEDIKELIRFQKTDVYKFYEKKYEMVRDVNIELLENENLNYQEYIAKLMPDLILKEDTYNSDNMVEMLLDLFLETNNTDFKEFLKEEFMNINDWDYFNNGLQTLEELHEVTVEKLRNLNVENSGIFVRLHNVLKPGIKITLSEEEIEEAELQFIERLKTADIRKISEKFYQICDHVDQEKALEAINENVRNQDIRLVIDTEIIRLLDENKEDETHEYIRLELKKLIDEFISYEPNMFFDNLDVLRTPYIAGQFNNFHYKDASNYSKQNLDNLSEAFMKNMEQLSPENFGNYIRVSYLDLEVFNNKTSNRWFLLNVMNDNMERTKKIFETKIFSMNEIEENYSSLYHMAGVSVAPNRHHSIKLREPFESLRHIAVKKLTGAPPEMYKEFGAAMVEKDIFNFIEKIIHSSNEVFLSLFTEIFYDPELLSSVYKPCDIKDYQDKDLGKYKGTLFEKPIHLITDIFKDRVMDMCEDVDFLLDIMFLVEDIYTKDITEVKYKGKKYYIKRFGVQFFKNAEYSYNLIEKIKNIKLQSLKANPSEINDVISSTKPSDHYLLKDLITKDNVLYLSSSNFLKLSHYLSEDLRIEFYKKNIESDYDLIPYLIQDKNIYYNFENYLIELFGNLSISELMNIDIDYFQSHAAKLQKVYIELIINHVKSEGLSLEGVVNKFANPHLVVDEESLDQVPVFLADLVKYYIFEDVLNILEVYRLSNNNEFLSSFTLYNLNDSLIEEILQKVLPDQAMKILNNRHQFLSQKNRKYGLEFVLQAMKHAIKNETIESLKADEELFKFIKDVVNHRRYNARFTPEELSKINEEDITFQED